MTEETRLANRTKLTPRARERFLEILRVTANVSNAARAVGMSRRGCYDARERDPGLARDWDDAVEIAAMRWKPGHGAVVSRASRRLVISMGKPVMIDGKLLMRRAYSDHLLLAQLKAHRPERYRENVRVDVTFDIGDRLEQATRYRDSIRAEVIEGAATVIEDKSA